MGKGRQSREIVTLVHILYSSKRLCGKVCVCPCNCKTSFSMGVSASIDQSCNSHMFVGGGE